MEKDYAFVVSISRFKGDDPVSKNELKELEQVCLDNDLEKVSNVPLLYAQVYRTSDEQEVLYEVDGVAEIVNGVIRKQENWGGWDYIAWCITDDYPAGAHPMTLTVQGKKARVKNTLLKKWNVI